MAINIGIVGLPNVGKSTLFNALSAAGAEAANFPFCTIEPNVGVVPVPDPRLDELARIFGSKKIIPTSMEFVDIAGLVKGAAGGEGLGNQFLSNIRQTHAIAHVVRCFEDENVVHVDGSVDPLRDVEVIDTELGLKDLESLEKRLDKQQKQAKAPGKPGEEAKRECVVLEKAIAWLNEGNPLRTMALDDEARAFLREVWPLTIKPVLYVANVAEDMAANPEASPHFMALKKLADSQGAPIVAVSAAIESELSQLEDAERAEYLADMGLEEPGLHKVIRAGYELLGLITFLTAGPQESRAWTVKKGTPAPAAASVIHSDIERGFIKAEVMKYPDLLELGSESAVKAAGKMKQEGRDYIIEEGDVVYFKFNV